MYTHNFRFVARQSLRGHWGISVLTLFVAGLLGAGVTNVVTTLYRNTNNPMSIEDYYYLISGLFSGEAYYYFTWSLATMGFIGFIALLYGLFRFIFGAAVDLGVNQFTMRLVLRLEPHQVGTLFFRFHIFGRALLTRFLTALFVFLWSMIFYLPAGILMGLSSYFNYYMYDSVVAPLLAILGILLVIAGTIFLIAVQYRYAMAPYLLSQYPDIGALEAIRRSKEMMRGNKGRLFGLHFSFIGWHILCAFTFGVGYLWLSPYIKTAEAAFYLEISGQLPLWAKVPAQPPAYGAPPYQPQGGPVAGPGQPPLPPDPMANLEPPPPPPDPMANLEPPPPPPEIPLQPPQAPQPNDPPGSPPSTPPPAP